MPENDTSLPSEGPRIEVTENGPYLATGLPVTRRRIVRTEHDEPIAWETTGELDTEGTVALCRCGGSQDKPFCDGTHARNGFDGTETAPTDAYDDRAKTYEGTGVVVRDDRGICEHAGFCTNRVTNVWKMARGGDTEDSRARSQLMAMIERCPSGALTYRMSTDGRDIENELRAAVGVTDDGPLYVTGRVAVQRADGRPMEARNRMALCRCGASKLKPLCDGSHASVGFHDRSTSSGRAEE